MATTSMSKLWAAALLACALGGTAHAANVTVEQAQMRDDLHTCWTGGYGSVGFPKGGYDLGLCLETKSWGTGIQRSDWIAAIETCAAKDEPYCVDMLAYIRERWGVR